jgi:hypothetical protein
VRLSDDWATLHKTLDKLNSLANHPEIAQQNAAAYPLVAANRTEQDYFPDTNLYQQSSPPGPMGFYTATDSLQPMNREDQRHASVQYSVISEADVEPPRGTYFPSTSPVSPYERPHPYPVHQELQY